MWSSTIIVPVAFAIAWVLVTWVKARHGISDEPGWNGDPKNLKVPPMFDKLVSKAMEPRDAEIKALKERVEVLEKIVVDNHKGSHLADEIDRLRDQS